MKANLLLTACAFTCLIASLANADDAPAAPDAPPRADIGRNAALIYWQAFDQLDGPKKDAGFLKALSDYDTVAINDAVRGYVKDSTPLDLLHLAAAVEPCDWGIGMLLKEQGPYTLLPHLSRCRELARLAMLRARVRLADKQGGKAVDDLIAVHHLARHSQAGSLLIGQLVGVATQSMALQFVADHFSSFDDADLAAYRKRRAALPAMVHVKDTVASERDGLGEWVKRALMNIDNRVTREQLAALFVEDETEGFLRKLMDADLPQRTAIADEMLMTYDPLIPMLQLPPDQFIEAHDQWMKKVNDSNNVLLKTMIPAYRSVYDTYHRSLATSALMQAALALRLDGRAKFDMIKDPYGDGPFTMKTGDDGTAISSKLRGKDGNPVTLKLKWKPTE